MKDSKNHWVDIIKKSNSLIYIWASQQIHLFWGSCTDNTIERQNLGMISYLSKNHFNWYVSEFFGMIFSDFTYTNNESFQIYQNVNPHAGGD